MKRVLTAALALSMAGAGLLAVSADGQVRPRRVATTAAQPAAAADRDHRSGPASLRTTSIARTARAGTVVPMSTGYYRVPYEDGTKVRINNDHNGHSPVGRYDMVGTGGGPYRIVAAARGRIEAIEDGFSAQQDSDTAAQCNNNYVWIRHPNGEVTKYSHMQKASTKGKAGLKVGDRVSAGQYLGDEGTVGCASGNHLHFEVGQPRDNDWFTTVGGFLRDNGDSKRNRIARICGISGGKFVSGQTYTATSEPDMLDPGASEIARHGMPISDYQCFFDQARLADYEPAWIDMFNIGGSVFVNTVWRPESGGRIAAFHGLSDAQYQSRFNEWTGRGYRPVLIESYLQGGAARYAAVFKQGAGPAYSAYHGLDANAHQQKFDSLTAQGFRPAAVSVVSSGTRRYTALFEKADVGAFQLKSQLTPAAYQQEFTENKAAGRHVAYLNGYSHGGQSYIVALFTSKAGAGGKQRHGLTGGGYQSEYEAARSAGMLTRAVTAYAEGSQARYAASWR